MDAVGLTECCTVDMSQSTATVRKATNRLSIVRCGKFNHVFERWDATDVASQVNFVAK